MIPGQAQQFFEAAAAQAGGGFQIERSLRFNSADSAYLNRTPSSAGDRRTWTWSAWVKRSGITAGQALFMSEISFSEFASLTFNSSDQLQSYLDDDGTGGYVTNATDALFRDVSAWYHVVWAVDSTNATASDRVKLYVNGVDQSYTGGNIPQNGSYPINSTTAHSTGIRLYNNADKLDAYLADIHFIDGQQLAATDFGEYDDNNVWQPKEYSGTYGTNGFYLKFDDNSSNAALGTDSSGNNNTWTVNNLTAESPLSLPGVQFDGSGDYLTVPASADNNYGTGDFTMEWYQKWTSLSGYQTIWSNNYTSSLLVQTDTGTGKYRVYAGGSYLFVETNAPEVGRWYHYALVRSGNTFTIYRDGTANGSVSSTNSVGDSTNVATIGQGSTNYVNGVISNFRVVKGTAVYTSPFTRPTAPLTNITNTVLLCCQSDTSTTEAAVSPGALTESGDPVAGTFNDSSPADDSLIDSPTNYTAESGNNGGNYPVFNPLYTSNSGSWSNGNLEASVTGTATRGQEIQATVAIPSSGKWYFEITPTDTGSSNIAIGLHAKSGVPYANARVAIYKASGFINVDGTNVRSDAATYAAQDVIGVAVDADNDSVSWYKNNSLVDTQTSVPNIPGSIPGFAQAAGSGTCTAVGNFGQRPFAYTPPTGHLSLCTQNLPDPTIADGSDYFDVDTYQGTGSTHERSNFSFSPDFLWVKARGGTASPGSQNHYLVDTVRGASGSVTKKLFSNSNGEENAGQTDANNGIDLQSDGFELTTGDDGTNNANNTYVAWAWDGGTSTGSNTDGTITSQVRANQSAGFSIVSYSGVDTPSTNTVGHGLGVAPSIYIIKNRTTAGGNWVFNTTAIDGSVDYMFLNTTAAKADQGSPWDTLPTSSVFTLGANDLNTCNDGDDYIAYCFAPVEGFSAFGTYTGNGNADGPFVHTGHRSRFLLIKASSIAGEDWVIIDTERETYNTIDSIFFANTNSQEITNSAYNTDILSNGFKLRGTNPRFNQSGATYIFASFAEHPFKTARAR